MKRRSGKLTIRADPRAVSMAAAIRAAAMSAPLLVLTGRALAGLADELGGFEAAMAELLAIATEIGSPIGVNFTTGRDTSKTAFVPPKSWTEERLAGWIGGHHAELEGEFGDVTRVGRSGCATGR